MKTHHLKTKRGNTLKIGDSSRALVSSLFNPGGTLDGYIIRRTRWTIRFFTLGREWVLNRWGVICNVCKNEDGREWYTHTTEFDLMGGNEFAASLTAQRVWCGKELARQYTA